MKKFTLRILWLKDNIGLSVDHIGKEGLSPLTSYFFWPRNDAWTQIKQELESKPWMSNDDKIDILNKSTEIISYWQSSNKEGSLLNKVVKKFPGCIVYSSQ